MILDQLKRRGFPLANRCPLCGMDEENIEHLLIHCSVVYMGMWTSILAAMGITWVPPYLVRDLLMGLEEIFSEKGGEKDLVGCSSLHFFGCLEGKKQGGFCNDDFLPHRLKSSFVFPLHDITSHFAFPTRTNYSDTGQKTFNNIISQEMSNKEELIT